MAGGSGWSSGGGGGGGWLGGVGGGGGGGRFLGGCLGEGAWGCLGAFACVFSIVGLWYRGDSCIRLVNSLDLLSIDRFIRRAQGIKPDRAVKRGG